LVPASEGAATPCLAGTESPARLPPPARAVAHPVNSYEWLNMNTVLARVVPAPFAISRSAPFEMARSASRRIPIRNIAAAALIVLAASAIGYAEERLQGWIPEVLAIPEDAEVVTDRAVGSSVRMFSIATEADVDELFAEWEDSLSTNAYPVTGGQSELLEHSIEFSGPGIANAKIIVAPKVDGGPRIIEFDATLD